jgi:hypothetical protein
VFQLAETNANVLVIGISLYDLNEEHLCDARANIVPFARTIKDLWQSHSDWQFFKRVLSQYPLAWIRTAFPTAGRSDAVLVGFRARLRELLQLPSAAADRARALVLPSGPILEFGETTQCVSDWSEARMLRRLAVARSENHGEHRFDGPKRLAFLRMLRRAEQKGRAIIVALPVSSAYVQEFVTADVARKFEDLVTEAGQIAPQAQLIRLDQVPGLSSNQHFSDLVHLNSSGRRIATESLIDELKKRLTRP